MGWRADLGFRVASMADSGKGSETGAVDGVQIAREGSIGIPFLTGARPTLNSMRVSFLMIRVGRNAWGMRKHVCALEAVSRVG